MAQLAQSPAHTPQISGTLSKEHAAPSTLQHQKTKASGSECSAPLPGVLSFCQRHHARQCAHHLCDATSSMSANQLLLVLKESIAARLWHTDVADTQPVPSVDDLLDSGHVDRENK